MLVVLLSRWTWSSDRPSRCTAPGQTSPNLACGLLLRQGLDLGEHLLHPPANLLTLPAQPDDITPQALGFFLALFQLFAQAFDIPLGCAARLVRRLVQLDGAINVLFQNLKIDSRNLCRQLFCQFEGHDGTS